MVNLAAVTEYLAVKVLELAENATRDNKKTRIIIRYLQLPIRNDKQLNKLLSSVTIVQRGILPNIQAALLPKKTEKKPSGGQFSSPREFYPSKQPSNKKLTDILVSFDVDSLMANYSTLDTLSIIHATFNK